MEQLRSVETDWLLYARPAPEGWPLIVRTRVLDEEIRTGMERFGLATIRCALPDDRASRTSLPGAGILDALWQWEEGVQAWIGDEGIDAVHLATLTDGGGRSLIYAAPREFQAPSVGSAAFGSVTATFSKDASELWTLITGTDFERQRSSDIDLLGRLAEHGDDGETPRRIEFFFLGERSALENASAMLQPADFRRMGWTIEPPGMVLSLFTLATIDVFEKLTPVLLDVAAIHHVQYDGWRSPVVSAIQE